MHKAILTHHETLFEAHCVAPFEHGSDLEFRLHGLIGFLIRLNELVKELNRLFSGNLVSVIAANGKGYPIGSNE